MYIITAPREQYLAPGIQDDADGDMQFSDIHPGLISDQ
jgi:hypothetical protein